MIIVHVLLHLYELKAARPVQTCGHTIDILFGLQGDGMCQSFGILFVRVHLPPPGVLLIVAVGEIQRGCLHLPVGRRLTEESLLFREQKVIAPPYRGADRYESVEALAMGEESMHNAETAIGVTCKDLPVWNEAHEQVQHTTSDASLNEVEQHIGASVGQGEDSAIPALRWYIILTWRRQIICSAVAEHVVAAVRIADAHDDRISTCCYCQSASNSLDDREEVRIAVKDVASTIMSLCILPGHELLT